MQIKTINFTLNSLQPLYLQLYNKIKTDIIDGFLKQDDRLPSIRKMAENLGLSRTTIETAYQQLCMEGYVYSLSNRGYFIQLEQAEAKYREQLLTNVIVNQNNDIVYDFSSDSVDPLCFDITLWKRYIKDSLNDNSSIYTYGDPQGEPILRNALQRYSYTMRGVLCKPSQVIIGASFQSLLQLTCSFLTKHSRVAMEDCGFAMAEQVFKDYNFEILKFPMIEEGINIESLKQLSVHVLYLNSAAVGTKKRPLSPSQRKELLQWAKEYHVQIIEDDHNGELRYVSKSTPALQGIDSCEQVIYIGSFSKLLMPSLRIGYMVLPSPLLQLYENRKEHYSPTASKIEQMALAHYILDGHLEKQIRRSKKRYEAKSNLMLSICKEVFEDWTIQLEETALRIRLKPPVTNSITNFIQYTRKHHIRIQSNQDEILLSFTSISVEDLPFALRTLKQLWDEINML